MNDGARDRSGESKDETTLSELDTEALLFRKLYADVLLLTTSWPTSRETTCLRSTSESACELVLRNIPVSTADSAYCEALTRPGGDYFTTAPQERPHFNCFSPLRY